jgi:GntR family transcriptional regulator
MLFRLDPANGLALYEQIVRQLKFAVASGALAPGQMIPSVRELAQRLAVNPNTVARAYRDLQADGILEALRGEGLRVAARAAKKCRDDRRALLAERLGTVLRECQQSGLSTAEIRTLIDLALSKASPDEAAP